MLKQTLSLLAAGLFAGAAIGQCSSVTTLTTAGNGQNGTMFDIVNVSGSPLNITTFDQCFFNAGTSAFIEIYTKVGTWNGSQQTPGAWTLVGSTTSFVHGVAPALDALPIPVNVTIAPGGTQGFYITGDIGTTVAYTTGVGQLGSVIGSDTALQVTGGVGVPYSFGAPFGLPTAGRLWNGRVNYCVSGGGTVFATNTTVGAGCISVADISSYELFAAASFDLSNTAMTWLRTASGYLAIPGVTTFVPPSGSAQVLALGDDSEATVTLSGAMPVGATGSTSALTVCSNGFISPATGNGVGFTPTAATFLAGPQAWWSVAWHDYNPAIAGSGQVKFEQVGGIAYITWDGVWDFGGTSASNANTFQAQFDVATGTVHIIYQTMSTLGNGHLVGYSDAGASADPGSMDISAALPATYSLATFAVQPVTLTATTRPIIGTSWNFTTSNVPASGNVGVDIIGLADPAVLDLGLLGLGLSGCQLRATLDVLNAWLVAGSSHNFTFAVPNLPSALNLHLFVQSAVLELPSLAQTRTSNGIDGRIGDF
jgi:hypothetical protein